MQLTCTETMMTLEIVFRNCISVLYTCMKCLECPRKVDKTVILKLITFYDKTNVNVINSSMNP